MSQQLEKLYQGFMFNFLYQNDKIIKKIFYIKSSRGKMSQYY